MNHRRQRRRRLVTIVLGIWIGLATVVPFYYASTTTSYHDTLKGQLDVSSQSAVRIRPLGEQEPSARPLLNSGDSFSRSSVHCIGDNFLPSAWMYRSCHYRHVCYNSTNSNLELYMSKQDEAFQQQWNDFVREFPYSRSSSSAFQNTSTLEVSLTGTTPWWARKKRFAWSPNIKNLQEDRNLEKNSVVIPMMLPNPQKKAISMMQWISDVLFSIYTLLGLFDLVNDKPNIWIWMVNESDIPSQTLTQLDTLLALAGGWKRWQVSSWKDGIKCFDHAVAGIGSFTMKGLSAYKISKNQPPPTFPSGKAKLYYDFVQYLHHSVGSAPMKKQSTKLNVKLLTYGLKQQHMTALSKVLQSKQNNVALDFVNLPDDTPDLSGWTDWMSLAQATDVAICHFTSPHSCWWTMMVPKGATVLFLFDSTHGSHPELTPEILVWNNLAHLQLHWVSIHEDASSSSLVERILEILHDKAAAIQQQSINQETDRPAMVGTWNGLPLYPSVGERPQSSTHCIGETWNEHGMAPHYRSCHYTNSLCLDQNTQELVLLVEGDDSKNQSNMAVMMGHTIRQNLEASWSPKIKSIRNISNDAVVFLPESILWLPFYSEQPNVMNVGHLLWDYFLPFYQLSTMFFVDKSPITTMFPLTLDPNCHKTSKCHATLSKFLPTIGMEALSSFSTLNESIVELRSTDSEQSPPNYVCARHAAVGIGMLTDHGFQKHGQLIEDYQTVHNVGKGSILWGFRNFILKNMNVKQQRLSMPYQVTISIHSSNNPHRNLDFADEIRALQNSFLPTEVTIQAVEMGKLSLQAQLEWMQTTTVWISVMGGAASTALFLPRGASVILYYDSEHDLVRGSTAKKAMPTMMDWDVWNHASHLRLHWMPIPPQSSNDTKKHTDMLIALVRNELEQRMMV